MDIFAQLVEKIIKEQENIIGPVAVEQAAKVEGLKVDWVKREIELKGDKKEIIQALVNQYKYLFGRASVEVCKDAVKDIISQVPTNQVPDLLQ